MMTEDVGRADSTCRGSRASPPDAVGIDCCRGETGCRATETMGFLLRAFHALIIMAAGHFVGEAGNNARRIHEIDARRDARVFETSLEQR